MLGDTRSALLPAILFALSLAFDVGHAVMDVNRLSYWSQDAVAIGAAALLLIGVPAAISFVVLRGVLGRWAVRWSGDGTAAALGVVLAGVVIYGVAASIVDSAEAGSFLRSHLGLACFVGVAMLTLWRRPGARLALVGAFVAGAAVTVAGGGRNVPYASVVAQVNRLRVSPVPFAGRVLLLGVDGLGWGTLQRWAAAHRSENYAWFRQHALQAPLDTLVPTLSPRIWSSIATGVPPEDHGVVGFTSLDYPGLYHSRLLTPPFEGAFYWTRLLQQLGAAQRLPVSSLDLRKPPIWELLARPAYPVDVLAWWASWPAQPILGRMVSDRFYFSRDELDAGSDQPAPRRPAAYGARSASQRAQTSSREAQTPSQQARTDQGQSGRDAANPPEAPDGLTFPPQLEQALEPLRRSPESMSDSELAQFLNPPAGEGRDPAAGTHAHDPRAEIRYAYTSDETWFGIAMKFLDDEPRNSTMVAYFRGVDMVSHGATRFSHLYAETDAANRETDYIYNEALCRYYDYAFSRLRELIEKAGSNTVVLIVSDHGFEHEGDGEFGHYHAPQGVFMALGGGRTGVDAAESFHVYDVAPTLLWLRGYPAGEDMPGRAHDELFPNLQAGQRQTLATYGYRLVEPGASLDDAKADEEMMRLLKTLGYVQ
jgi:hypothetical protein